MSILPRKQQALDTKNKIYESVRILLKNNLMEDIKIEDICKEANVSVGTFYNYFKNKDDILKVGIEKFDAYFEEEVKNIKTDNPYYKLENSIHLYLNAIDNRGYYHIGLLLKFEISSEDENIIYNRALYKYIQNNIILCVKNNVLNGDPNEITNEIYRLLKGTIFQWVIDKGRFNIIHEGKNISNIVLNYYKK